MKVKAFCPVIQAFNMLLRSGLPVTSRGARTALQTFGSPPCACTGVATRRMICKPALLNNVIADLVEPDIVMRRPRTGNELVLVIPAAREPGLPMH